MTTKKVMKTAAFFTPCVVTKKSTSFIKANFFTRPSEDFMVRGGQFYAVYNPNTGLWSKDEFTVQELVDDELWKLKETLGNDGFTVISLKDSTSGGWLEYYTWVRHQPDHWQELDGNVIFANTETTKDSYASHKLSYQLVDGDYSAWDELVGSLYSESERQKIEWAIGSVVCGDSKILQKFFVLYGAQGTGKSTILKIIAD